MESLVTGGAECGPGGGRNQLSQFMKHIEGKSDGSFQDQFGGGGSGDLMQHAGGSSSMRPLRRAEFDDKQFVEEFHNFEDPRLRQGPGEAFHFGEMKSELGAMLERQGPPMAMGAGGDWANDFGRFQEPIVRPGAGDDEFEAAYMNAMRHQGPVGRPGDWSAEFANGDFHHDPQTLDAEFSRFESAFANPQHDPLEAAWTEQFSRISEDVKGKGPAVAEGQSELAKWETEFNRIRDAMDKDGEMKPEMMEQFNEIWKTLADRDGVEDTIEGGQRPWEQDFEDFDYGGSSSLVDPDPVTSECAPYNFEEVNPYLSHADPMAEGLRLMKGSGSLSAAALAFEAAVQRDPESSDAWMWLGRVQAENEKEGPAVAALQRSVQENPKNLAALLLIFEPKNLAVSYTNDSLELQSYATLERWINTKYPSLLESQPPPPSGLMSSPSELHERASRLFIEAVKLGPSASSVPVASRDLDPEVQEGLGVLFYMRGEFEKAVDCFGAALGVDPTNYLLWNRLGATLANSGKSEEAIDAYYKALEIKPTFVRCRYNLGISCINIGCHREAAEHLLGALSLHEVDGTKSGGGAGASGRMLHVSENLWETLRRTFMQMDRRDLADLTVADRDLSKFRKDFEF